MESARIIPIRIIEKHINDFPPDEYESTYKNVISGCFGSPGGTYKGGPGLHLLAKGEFIVLVDFYLNKAFTETAYIQLVSKKDGSIYRMFDSSLTWGHIAHGLNEMGVKVFHTHHYKNGKTYHYEGYGYLHEHEKGKKRWKSIFEHPDENLVKIRSDKGNGLKIVEIETCGGREMEASPDEWLEILQKVESRESRFSDPYGYSECMTILNRSYSYLPE